MKRKLTVGVKFDAGKPRMDLVFWPFVLALAKVLGYGAVKYDPRNWEKGMDWGRVFGALQRHLAAFWGGEANDPESGLPHLAHAACCLMFLFAYHERNLGEDDRGLQ